MIENAEEGTLQDQNYNIGVFLRFCYKLGLKNILYSSKVITNLI